MSVNNNPLEKIFCLVAYIFSLPGVLLVCFVGKKSKYCLHHARRSLELFLFIFFLFIFWFVITFILMLIPYGGFPLAIALFGIVVAAAIFCLVLSIMGIFSVLRGEIIVFPFVTSFMNKIEPVFMLLGLSEK